ncbi:hypothetical protein F383_36730 [Gossypium arboreum]|uniref:Uncharacterized protein n=1 Tax=Gossypium arboreum TaxID=29729 RepID=A0A0B0MAC6_GOSAR|nr:hypothetical protein F383_36730 [Gossypium arboreum]
MWHMGWHIFSNFPTAVTHGRVLGRLARPSTRPSTWVCVATSKDTWARHKGVWSAV